MVIKARSGEAQSIDWQGQDETSSGWNVGLLFRGDQTTLMGWGSLQIVLNAEPSSSLPGSVLRASAYLACSFYAYPPPSSPPS